MKAYRFAALLLILTLLLTGCGGSDREITTLKFSEATSFENLRRLDGKTVSIVGYMATLSPISGKYMYLMNMPYQSCPFCVPNTTQLANTMAVYAPNGKTFAYTDQAVRITGRLEIGDSTDDFGYQYNYRIADASCETVDLGEISKEYALWQSIASDGVAAEISAMFDYLYLMCDWCECSVSYIDENGEEVSYFLYPGDVEQYLADDSAYGYAKFADADYFPALIRRVNAISDTELTDLRRIIEESQTLADDAQSELNAQNYVYDENADQYSLVNGLELTTRFNDLYSRFSEWLAGWEI